MVDHEARRAIEQQGQGMQKLAKAVAEAARTFVDMMQLLGLDARKVLERMGA